jgi:hypothetical protein
MTPPLTVASLPDLHTLDEVADRYGLSARALWDRARGRKFEHIRFGKQRYMTNEQIAALLSASTVSTDDQERRDADLAATRERLSRARSRRRPA